MRRTWWRYMSLVNKIGLCVDYYTCNRVQADVPLNRLQCCTMIHMLNHVFLLHQKITPVLFFCISMELLLPLQRLCGMLCDSASCVSQIIWVNVIEKISILISKLHQWISLELSINCKWVFYWFCIASACVSSNTSSYSSPTCTTF